MKATLTLIAQTILFLVVFLAGTLLDPFHLKWFITHPTLTSTRYFVPDGVLLMLALYLVILIVQLLRKHLAAARLSTLAVLLALALGLLSKFGLATHDLF